MQSLYHKEGRYPFQSGREGLAWFTVLGVAAALPYSSSCARFESVLDGSGKTGYPIVGSWGWLSPGGLRGLQNRLRGAAEAALVGSTPIHSRFACVPGLASRESLLVSCRLSIENERRAFLG